MTKIFCFTEREHFWNIFLDPLANIGILSKQVALHTENQIGTLRDAMWNSIQLLVPKPRFTIPVIIYVPTLRAFQEPFKSNFLFEFEQRLNMQVPDSRNLQIKKMSILSRPRRYFRHSIKPEYKSFNNHSIQVPLKGELARWL